jgi:hypothetical protein
MACDVSENSAARTRALDIAAACDKPTMRARQVAHRRHFGSVRPA